jgi:hypothetical protein
VTAVHADGSCDVTYDTDGVVEYGVLPAYVRALSSVDFASPNVAGPPSRAPGEAPSYPALLNAQLPKVDASSAAALAASASGPRALATASDTAAGSDLPFGAASAVGEKLQAQDSRSGIWYDAKVVKIDGEGDGCSLKVHYMGWKARFDEWIRVDQGRLRAMGAPSPRAPQPDGSAPEAEDDDEAAAVEAKEPPPPPPPPSMSYENYGVDAKVGDALEALDVLGKWHSARVVQLEGEGMARTVLVHFPGWNA